MAGAISGALHGSKSIRPNWIEQINRANRVDLAPLALDLTITEAAAPETNGA